MIALELCDALENATTFSHTNLDYAAISHIYCPRTREDLRQYFEEMLDVARSRGRTAIARSIKRALRRSQVFLPFKQLSYRLRSSPKLRPIGNVVEAGLDRLLIS